MIDLPAWTDRALDAVLPPLCLHCGAALVGARPGWCAACATALARPERGCRRCGLPGPPRTSCGRCRRWPEGLRALAAVRHAGPAKSIVHALKYRGWRHLARACADLMAAAVDDAGIEVAAVAPIPLHPIRRRERGYDQAGLLAEALAARLDRPSIDPLERVRATPPQVGRDRVSRMANVADAFRCRPGRLPRGRVALVDDVTTSGATLVAAAGPVLEGGAGAALGVTFSLAPRPDSV